MKKIQIVFFLVCLILFLVISRCSLLGPRLFISRKTWVSGMITLLPDSLNARRYRVLLFLKNKISGHMRHQ